jgi:hypothetical protein
MIVCVISALPTLDVREPKEEGLDRCAASQPVCSELVVLVLNFVDVWEPKEEGLDRQGAVNSLSRNLLVQILLFLLVSVLWTCGSLRRKAWTA